jgi:hypothetical protein
MYKIDRHNAYVWCAGLFLSVAAPAKVANSSSTMTKPSILSTGSDSPAIRVAIRFSVCLLARGWTIVDRRSPYVNFHSVGDLRDLVNERNSRYDIVYLIADL